MHYVRAQGIDEPMIIIILIIILFPTAVIVKASRQLYWVACALLWLHDVGLGEGGPNLLNLRYIGPDNYLTPTQLRKLDIIIKRKQN